MNNEIREMARQLSEAVAEDMSDEEKETAHETATLIAAELRETCGVGTVDEVASLVAQSVCQMFAAVQTTELQRVGRLLDSNMCAYALAAGALAGVYPLPEVEGSDSAPGQQELTDEWRQILRTEPDPQIGQYL